MDLLSSLASVGALGINLHALLALVLGMRGADAESVARYARRCSWSAGGFALVSAIFMGTAILTSREAQGDSPVERASRLAMRISEGMNCTAFILMGVLFPLVVVGVLHLRARRLRGRSGGGEG